MSDIKDRAREYLIKHSEYSEVFDQTFVAVDTLTAMVDFAEQENEKLNNRCKKYEQQISAMESGTCTVCSEVDKELQIAELQEENKNLRDNYELHKAATEPTIKELQAYNEKLLNSDIEKHNKIVSLEAQIEEAKDIIRDFLNRSDKTAERAEKFLSEVEK